MKPKKILAWILTLAMLIPMLSGINLTAMAEETIDTNLYEDMLDKIKEENNYGLSENIDSGTILNAWNWSFDSIADNMKSIAEQGFTAVLVSPPNEIKMATKDKKFQEPSENGVSPNGWWMFYEPVGFQINESSDNALGTKADFVEMCDTAESYGVKIMVDAVVGYMGSDDDHVGEYNNTNPDVMTHISAKIREFEPEIYAAEAFHNPWVNMTYKMNYWDGYTDYAIEEDLTQHAAGGKPDLATETQLVQDLIYDYLKELLDAGTDGFWFSDVTHIETPSDTHFGSDFWDDTLAKLRDDYPNEEIYAIGEVYNKLGDGREPSDYTGYMDLTYTDVYWPIKNAAQNASYSNESLPVWTDDSYIPQENTVLWVETGLTYTDGGTASLTVEQRNKIWALIASRKDITSIYFSRPDDTPKSSRAEVESLLGDYTLGYANTSVLSDEVVKNVNHFANYFGNAEEGVYQESDVAVITKTDGSKIVGATVVNLDGTTGAVEINLGNVDDGNYIDSVEGNTFTIEGGVLKGNIGESGVATLYFTGNPTYTVTVNEAENGTVTADKTSAAAGDEVTLTIEPATGHELDTLTVKDADDNDVTVTDNKFTMPAKNVTVTATFKAIEYAASVTTSENVTTYYTTLYAALTAAKDANGSTLKLLKEYNNYIIIDSGSFTLDLNGKTIQVDGSATAIYIFDSNSKITIMDSVGNGEIISASVGLSNSGTLTIKSGIIKTEGIGVDNQGTLLVSGGTITSTGNSVGFINQGTATITGGSITGVVYGADNSGTLTVKNDAVLYGGESDIKYESGSVDLSEWNNAGGTTIHNLANNFTISDSTIKLPAGYYLMNENGDPQTELESGKIYTVGTDLTTYTVTFDANGGTDAPTTATTGTDGKLTEFPAPVREGYIFNGWFDAAEGGNAVTLDTVFTANTTIYAHWTEKKYEIYVGGEQVTAENAADVLSDGTVSYNAETNTLTLNNANLTSGTTYNNNLAIATILAKDDLNIELKGTNRITAPDMTGFSNGISVDGDLTIFGSGSLTTIGGNITGVAETGEIGRFESSGIYASDLLTIRTAEVNAVGGTVSVTGDTIVESSNRICQVYSHGIVGGYGMVLEDGAKLNANGGSVSANTANIDFAFSKGVFVFYGDTIIYDAVLTATGGKVIGGENACSFGISTNYADVKVCDADAKVTLTADDVEATVLTGSNGISVHGGLDIQAGSVSVTSGKRTEGTNGDNDAVYVEGYTDGNGVTHGGNISLADGMKISVPKNGVTKKIDDTYYTIVDSSDNIATNVKIEARKKSYSGGGGGSSSNTTTTTTKNDDGSTTKTTINKITGTTTEVTTGTDGSTTTVETKKDGTVTTTEKDKDGNTTTTVENPDGSSTTTEKNKDGSEKVTEKATDGTTTTTEKDAGGNKTVTTEKADGTTTTEETRKDGTTVKTETTASGETTAEVETKGETEVVIPAPNASEVTKVVVTDKDGSVTEVEFEVKDGGVAISVSGNSTVSVQTGHICYAKDFTDVDLDSWYHLNIDYVLENGLMKGTAADKFAPNDNLTRAMLVTVLYRLEGEPRVSGITSFADLEKGGYYLDAVCWAQLNGIVNGVSETEFAPNSNITREQIATIMFRYAQYKGMDAVTLEENLHFVDNDDISEYAVSAMNWAVGTGLMKGKSTTTINPKDNATRAEIAAILHRFIEGNK